MAINFVGANTAPNKNIWRTFIGKYEAGVKIAYDSFIHEFVTNGLSPTLAINVLTLIDSLTQIGATRTEDTSGGIKSDKKEPTAEYGEMIISLTGNYESTLLNAIEDNVDFMRNLDGSKLIAAFVSPGNDTAIVFSPISYNHNESYEGGSINVIKLSGEKKSNHPNGINIICEIDTSALSTPIV